MGRSLSFFGFAISPACAEPDFRFFVKALVETSGTASHGVNRADDNRAAQQRRGQTIAQFPDWQSSTPTAPDFFSGWQSGLSCAIRSATWCFALWVATHNHRGTAAVRFSKVRNCQLRRSAIDRHFSQRPWFAWTLQNEFAQKRSAFGSRCTRSRCCGSGWAACAGVPFSGMVQK